MKEIQQPKFEKIENPVWSWFHCPKIASTPAWLLGMSVIRTTSSTEKNWFFQCGHLTLPGNQYNESEKSYINQPNSESVFIKTLKNSVFAK